MVSVVARGRIAIQASRPAGAISQHDSRRYTTTTPAAVVLVAPAASRLASTSPTPPGVMGICRMTWTAR